MGLLREASEEKWFKICGRIASGKTHLHPFCFLPLPPPSRPGQDFTLCVVGA